MTNHEKMYRRLVRNYSTTDIVWGLFVFLPPDHLSLFNDLRHFLWDHVPGMQKKYRGFRKDFSEDLWGTINSARMARLLMPDIEPGPDRIQPYEPHKRFTRESLSKRKILPHYESALRIMASHYVAFVNELHPSHSRAT